MFRLVMFFIGVLGAFFFVKDLIINSMPHKEDYEITWDIGQRSTIGDEYPTDTYSDKAVYVIYRVKNNSRKRAIADLHFECRGGISRYETTLIERGSEVTGKLLIDGFKIDPDPRFCSPKYEEVRSQLR